MTETGRLKNVCVGNSPTTTTTTTTTKIDSPRLHVATDIAQFLKHWKELKVVLFKFSLLIINIFLILRQFHLYVTYVYYVTYVTKIEGHESIIGHLSLKSTSATRVHNPKSATRIQTPKISH